MIKLVEVCELLKASKSAQQQFTLREIFINPKHVVALRAEPAYLQKLKEEERVTESDATYRIRGTP